MRGAAPAALPARLSGQKVVYGCMQGTGVIFRDTVTVSGCLLLRPLRLRRPVHPRLIARLLWRHGTARCRRTCDYGGFGNVCCCTCCIRWNLAQIQLWKHRRTLV
ncbi:DUF1472 domain-containing protein (plasmid) [Klebsiella pneumoniae]|nr:DUF1472 domain-containing protein [Klebsiella pneumoniae]